LVPALISRRLLTLSRSVIALVAATAGFPTTFTVTVRDSYGNPSDSNTLQRSSSGSATTTNPTSVRFEVVASDTVIRKVGVCASHNSRRLLISEMQVPLIWSAVGIWNAIFSPPAPGGPMNVVVKASSVWKRVPL
jgi:hypothetical protein